MSSALVRRETPTKKNSRILDFSLASVKLWFEREWAYRYSSPSLAVVFAPTLDASKEVGKARGISENSAAGRDLFPWAALTVVSYANTPSGYHPWIAQNVGFRVGYVDGKNSIVYERVRPVDVGIGIRFRCDNEEVSKAFAALWMENSPGVRFDMRNNRTGSIIETSMSLEPNVSLGQPDMSGSQGEGIRDMESTLILHTYIGINETVGSIKAMDVTTSTRPDLMIEEAIRLSGNGKRVDVTMDYVRKA